jgi:hypothetical protein
MQTIVREETTNTTRSCNPLGSLLDARDKSDRAYLLHHKKFNSPAHIDRVVAVCQILENFFNCKVTYLTYRGLGKFAKKPFENIKMEQVGHILSRTPVARKNENLYGPLMALGNVEVVSKNGHLIVRVY